MRERPRIGVTAWNRTVPTYLGPTPMETVNRWYSQAVRDAGGIPVLLLPVDPGDVDSLLEICDGLLLSGGDDVEPGVYGQERHPETQPPDPERDAFELALTRRAFATDVPLLAICRGMQVLNVALGGTLHQHVVEELPGVGDHQRRDAGEEEVHEVEVTAGSRLAGVVGTRPGVNSMHHQAVADVGPGLAAVAREPGTGVIEGIEAPGRTFCLAVQWHPEMLAQPGTAHLALFEALVSAARSSASASPTSE